MKIIRFTESDLTNIVKKVIKENEAKDSLIDMIKEDGWEETSELVGGSENLEKLVGIKTPMDFLHLFDDLNVVQSEETPDWTLFKYEKRTKLMVYNRLRNIVYINYYKFWRVLEYGFYLNDSEINELIQEWLNEVYDLRDVTIKADMIITGNPNIR
jgi:hypothetical protein